MVYYDPRRVEAHGSPIAKVYLINEAPGPREAVSGFPSFGDQGGNIYRALWRCNISWAKEFNDNSRFSWPKFNDDHYHNQTGKQKVDLRKKFLDIRRQYITCSNAFDQWPKPSRDSECWVAPDITSLRSDANIERIRAEISQTHDVLLICGCCAWQTIFLDKLENANGQIGRKLTCLEVSKVNSSLNSLFKLGFYMGHTSNWGKLLYRTRIDLTLAMIGPYIDMSLTLK